MKGVVQRDVVKPSVTRIIPARSITNQNTVDLARALYGTYKPLYRRVSINGLDISRQAPSSVWWEIELAKGAARWFVTTLPEWKDYIREKLEVCWPQAGLEDADDPAQGFSGTGIAAASCALRHHFFLATGASLRDQKPLHALLNVSRFLEDSDRALWQLGLVPIADEWHQRAQKSIRDFNKGVMPLRPGANPEKLLALVMEGNARLAHGVSSVFTEVLGVEPAEFTPPGREAPVGSLSRATLRKPRQPGFLVAVRVLVKSPSEERRRLLVRTLADAIQDANGDNEWTFAEGGVDEVAAVRARSLPRRIDANILGLAEVAKLIQVPGPALQSEYPIIAGKTLRENPVPKPCTQGGIPIGTAEFRGERDRVYFPVDDHDILCRTRVLAGEPGTGKTQYAATFAREAYVHHLYGSFVFDVADGVLCDSIRDSVPDEMADGIIDLDFGDLQRPIPISWYDSECYVEAAASRMRAELVHFLGVTSDDAGARTRRWMKKAAVVLDDPAANVFDVALMLTSKEYRAKIVPNIRRDFDRRMWEQFDDLSPGAQQQIIAPVLNRLDALLDNEHLLRIVGCAPTKEMSFRRWMDEGKLVLFRIPKSRFGKEATELLVTFLMAKIWMAALSRDRISENERRPCFVVADEPHQYMKAASHWEQMVVEARKFRLGLVFCFHSWAQIRPQAFKEILKASGPHYMLFTSAEETYRELAPKLAPFSIEEAMETPIHSAIVAPRGRRAITPFLTAVQKPAKKVRDRTALTRRCAEEWGRSVEEIDAVLSEKEACLLKG